MARPSSLSGFPEWLPRQRLVEQHVLDVLRRTFELHGFASVETRSVEPLDELLRKGEIDKEVYVLRRLHAAPDEADAGLGLHFDLTVPFARYVLENAGRLDFPFRRYQVQKVWRGERPQEGRYREFLQADVDVVGRDALPWHAEVDVPLIMGEALSALPIPPVVIRVNNRRLAEGFFREVGADDPAAVLRTIDKLEKIGPDRALDLLVADGLPRAAAELCLRFAEITADDASVADAVLALGVRSAQVEEGLADLVRVLEAAGAERPGLLRADLRIARGLDYYTGTVYETSLQGHEDLGSICSGGRYDSLATDGSTTYPGVGMSIGVSRLLGRLFARDLVTASRSVPTAVLVAVWNEEDRPAARAVARVLRDRGVATEVSPSADKLGKQIRYADRRGIPWVWFPGADGHEVKDLRSGDQVPADPASWLPPDDDRRPRVMEQRP